MDKIKTVETLKRIRPEIDAALAVIAKKYGIEKLALGKGTYDNSGSFSFKLEGVMAGGLSVEAQMYEAIREYEGLPPLGSHFDSAGTTHTIIGANRTGTKVLTTAFTGKKYLFTVMGVKRIFSMNAVLSAGKGGSVPVNVAEPLGPPLSSVHEMNESR